MGHYEQLSFNKEVNSIPKSWTLLSEIGSRAEHNFTSMEHKKWIFRQTLIFRISGLTFLERDDLGGS